MNQTTSSLWRPVPSIFFAEPRAYRLRRWRAVISLGSLLVCNPPVLGSLCACMAFLGSRRTGEPISGALPRACAPPLWALLGSPCHCTPLRWSLLDPLHTFLELFKGLFKFIRGDGEKTKAFIEFFQNKIRHSVLCGHYAYILPISHCPLAIRLAPQPVPEIFSLWPDPQLSVPAVPSILSPPGCVASSAK